MENTKDKCEKESIVEVRKTESRFPSPILCLKHLTLTTLFVSIYYHCISYLIMLSRETFFSLITSAVSHEAVFYFVIQLVSDVLHGGQHRHQRSVVSQSIVEQTKSWRRKTAKGAGRFQNAHLSQCRSAMAERKIPVSEHCC